MAFGPSVTRTNATVATTSRVVGNIFGVYRKGTAAVLPKKFSRPRQGAVGRVGGGDRGGGTPSRTRRPCRCNGALILPISNEASRRRRVMLDQKRSLTPNPSDVPPTSIDTTELSEAVPETVAFATDADAPMPRCFEK